VTLAANSCRTRFAPIFGLVFVLALLLVPSGALAADVSSQDYSIDYTASLGETNHVAVDQDGGNVTFTESGAGVTLNDVDGAGGCEVTGNVATCPEADLYWLNVTLADGDDEANVSAAVAMFAAIYGDTGNDTLSGGGGYSELIGDDGNDTLTGGTDEGYLAGYDGDDTIQGGPRNDFLDDGSGDDVVNGGDGDDEFFGDTGTDQFNGEAGNDYFNGFDFSGADTFSGGAGSDWLDYRRVRPVHVTLNDVADDGENCPGAACEGDNARSDIENLSGGRGEDTLIGDDDANLLSGEPGDDTLTGLGGDDQLLGDWGSSASPFGAGNDTMDGGTGNDFLFGDYGNDSLTGGPGVDGLEGDAGNDALNSDDGGGRDADGCGSGTDAVIGDTGDVVAGDCESVIGASIGGAAGLPAIVDTPAARAVQISRVTRVGRHVRVSAVSTQGGWVRVTLRKAGRTVATGRRWVQAGRKFTLTLTNRARHVRGGRYMLTTTLRPINGQVWTASQRVRVR
jgi:Ca2+-binding RTX toxin-like protein